MAKQTIDVMVTGGAASGGPPIGPALGPLGVNVLAVVNRINELTKDFAGMKVPVKVIVDTDTKTFEVEVGIPTTAALIAKEAKLEKGSSQPGREYVGDLTFNQVVTIARILNQKLGLKNMRSLFLQIVGTCKSMGVKVDGKLPEEVIKLIREGFYEGKMEGK
jgi:large subunit ribosomal protein L11